MKAPERTARITAMRAALIAVTIASLTTVAAAQTAGAPSSGAPTAQQQPSATTNGAATNAPAPVGHRQPTEKTLPSGVRKDEATPSKPDPLGPLPKICQDC